MSSPLFSIQPFVSKVRLAAASTDASALTNATQFTFPSAPAGAVGIRIDRIKAVNAQATYAASSAMTFRVHVSDGSGANPRLHAEVALAAATRSASAVGATSTLNEIGGFIIETTNEVYVSQSLYAGVQDQTDYILEGAFI